MLKSERYEFENKDGHKLAGRLELPDNPVRFAIFAHCFTCSKNSKASNRISRELAKKGIATLRFDFTGLGNSEGDFSNTNFSSNVQDLVSAAEALKQTHQVPSLIVGHSLGGTAALMAASKVPEIKAAATIGSPAYPEHVTHLFSCQIPTIEQEGKVNVSLAGRPFTIKKQFLDDVAQTDQKTALGSLNRPVMIFHSPDDEVVEIDQAREMYKWLKHPKSFMAVDGADHMLNDPKDAEFVASVLASWAERYL